MSELDVRHRVRARELFQPRHRLPKFLPPLGTVGAVKLLLDRVEHVESGLEFLRRHQDHRDRVFLTIATPLRIDLSLRIIQLSDLIQEFGA